MNNRGSAASNAAIAWVLGFAAQRSYRVGGAEMNFATGGLDEFDPEFLWNYELSARTSLVDGALNWNTNVYYSDWTDQQVTIPLDPPFDAFSQTVNAGPASRPARPPSGP